MTEQNFKNHTRLVPYFHYIGYLALLLVIVGSFYNAYRAYMSGSGRLVAAILVAACVCLQILFWFSRSFALKAQDRAIRAEENLRHFVLTGKPLPKELRVGQIVALRFASDAELPALAEKAVKEQLTNKSIKQLVQNWRADYNRV